MKKPLTLRAVKSLVSKGSRGSNSPANSVALTRLVQRLKGASDVSLQETAPDFLALEEAGLEGPLLLAAVLDVARKFHERTWETSDQQELKAEAEAEVGDLRDMLSEERFKSALEEVARDNLRKRYKLLSAPTLSQAFRS